MARDRLNCAARAGKTTAFLFLLNFDGDDRESRAILNLPTDGALEPSDINAASGASPRPRIPTPAAATNSTAASRRRATRYSSGSRAPDGSRENLTRIWRPRTTG